MFYEHEEADLKDQLWRALKHKLKKELIKELLWKHSVSNSGNILNVRGGHTGYK